MRKVLTVLLVVFILILLTGVGAAAAIYYFNSPLPSAGEGPLPFTIRDGESLSSVARRLESENIIRWSKYLVGLSKLRGTETSFQKGSYLVPRGKTTEEIHDFFLTGSQVLVRITIPEGWALRRTAAAFEEKNICTAEDFLAAAANKKLLEALGIPAPTAPVPSAPVPSALGYLYPDTYLFPEDFPADRVITEMVANFRSKVADIYPDAASLDAKELHDKVTLASIVEREYRIVEEAPLMASVFYNRLGIRMALGSCATVEYIITEILNRPHPGYLTYSDLEIPSPYNTYRHAGLPPGPISNPGGTALKSVFYPANTDYWYFVLKDPRQGTHHFSKNIDEHNRARVLYLKRVS